MKASLQLKVSQHLTLTPQLQQAIRFLQLSTLDLCQEIQEAVDSNPMLELQEENQPEEATNNESKEHEIVKEYFQEQIEVTEQLTKQDIPEELPVDSVWEDTYQSVATLPVKRSNEPVDYDYLTEINNKTETSLKDHLLWQIGLTPFSEVDEAIAIAIVDGINEDGMLMVSLDDIYIAVSANYEIEMDEVLVVLHRVQQLDPVGVGARDVSECLYIQLNQFDENTPCLSLAKTIVANHIKLLASRDFGQLMKLLNVKDTVLKSAVELIQSLRPRPGSIINATKPSYITPDVFVKKVNGSWKVTMNSDSLPKLQINQNYSSLVKRADNSMDNTFLRTNLQEARWFMKSIQSRNETLLKVANSIVQRQKAFFEQGEVGMVPLVLHDVAEEIEMHESTVSRVTTQKYMHTPRGIFELKYFFSSQVSTDSGSGCSSTAIRALIREFIGKECGQKPMSDSKIAKLLNEQGIQVARRTVAKYREAMAIPPSNERKTLS